jgi:HPt (histidine-containing phosphotransfer) domain-containing protein
MTKDPNAKPTVTSFADHEVITPPNALKRAVSHAVTDDDPVARAEAALAQLSSEFSGWMDADFERLDKARRQVRQSGMTKDCGEELFRAAHDIKSQAPTFGFPLVAAAADSLCRLIDHASDPRRIPFDLIDQHVDAVRAIMREQGRPGAEAIARELTQRLREVSRFFLRRGDNDPDGIESGPPIVPEK